MLNFIREVIGYVIVMPLIFMVAVMLVMSMAFVAAFLKLLQLFGLLGKDEEKLRARCNTELRDIYNVISK